MRRTASIQRNFEWVGNYHARFLGGLWDDEMYCCNNRKLMIKRNEIVYFVVYPLNQLLEVSNYGSL